MENPDSESKGVYLYREGKPVEDGEYLIVTSIEFNDEVTLHWINLRTYEEGSTIMSYEAYRNNQKPL